MRKSSGIFCAFDRVHVMAGITARIIDQDHLRSEDVDREFMFFHFDGKMVVVRRLQLGQFF